MTTNNNPTAAIPPEVLMRATETAMLAQGYSAECVKFVKGGGDTWTHYQKVATAALLAAGWAEMAAEQKRLLKEIKLQEHQIITCGVAATHPDPNLSRTGPYIGKWNTQQADEVRQLRDERDDAWAALAAIENMLAFYKPNGEPVTVVVNREDLLEMLKHAGACGARRHPMAEPTDRELAQSLCSDLAKRIREWEIQTGLRVRSIEIFPNNNISLTDLRIEVRLRVQLYDRASL